MTEREAAQHRLQGELASTSAALDRTIRRVLQRDLKRLSEELLAASAKGAE